MADKNLVDFILEARKRGFSDLQISNALSEKSWPAEEVASAFECLRPKFKLKNQICIFLPKEVLEMLEKRAKKNMFTLPEQIEDILRRSCTRKKTSGVDEKLDDVLITCFSRKNRGKK